VETGAGNCQFCLKVSLSYFEGFFNLPLILRHEAAGFTSFPKEGMLRIFIAFENPRTRELWVQWQARYSLDNQRRPISILIL
jgi:hypothetical protein